MVVWFAVWIGLGIALRAAVMDQFVMKADTAVHLLESYGRQQLWILIVTVSAIIITIGFAIAAISFQIKEWISLREKAKVGKWKYPFAMVIDPMVVIIVMAMFSWIPVFMLKEIRPLEKYNQLQKDIAAIEQGKLESATVYFSPDFKETDLVSIGKDYRNTVVCYCACGIKNTGEELPSWEEYYVPDFLEFTLDTENVYDEWKGLEWNREHTTMYNITYTPDIHLVTSVQVASKGKQ